MVDDADDFLAMVRGWLEVCYEVVAFREGGELVDVLAGLRPDLVLLDVGMRPSGFTICRQMRADARLKAVPVLFLTASHDDMDFIRSIQAGGTAYLTKPLSSNQLFAKIAEMLSVNGARP